MARRRLQGFGQALQNVGATLWENKQRTEREQRQVAAQLDKEQMDAFNTEVRTTLDPKYVGEVGPERAKQRFEILRKRLPPHLQSRVGEEPDFGSLDIPADERLASVMQEIGAATSAAGVPSREGVYGSMQRRRVAPRALPPYISDTDREGADEVGGNYFDSPELKRALSEAARKREDLEAGESRTKVSRVGPGGTMEDEFLTNRQLASQGAQRSERTPQEEGGRQRAIAGGQTRGRIETETDPALVTAEAGRQRSITGSQTQGRLETENAPTNVAGSARRAGALSSAEAGGRLGQEQRFGAGSFTPQVKEEIDAQGNTRYRLIRPQTGQSTTLETDAPAEQVTDSMRATYSYGIRGVSAHNTMAKLEPILANRSFLLQYRDVATSDAVNGIKDPVARQYALAAREFINAQARRESGASIPADEYRNYAQMLSIRPGDDSAAAQDKQNVRRRTIEGFVTQSGRRLGEQFVMPDEVAALAQKRGVEPDVVKRELESSGYKVVD